MDLFYADLSVQKEVINVAKEIHQRWGRVDVLFNNAGVLLDDVYLSKQGNEMHFEVNTIAPFLLAKNIYKNQGSICELKVVCTVTDMMHKQKKLRKEAILTPTKNKKLLLMPIYKVNLPVYDNEQLGKRKKEVKLIHVSPGPTKTKMTAGPGMPRWLVPLGLFFNEPSKGAKEFMRLRLQGTSEIDQRCLFTRGVSNVN